ncbi:MAG: CBS domain-containing protein, partial [Chitinophagaceae bacterium]
MLTGELQSQNLPYLHLSDKVYQALQLMNDNRVTHLPVVEGEKFMGIISEDDLLVVDNENAELITLQQSFGNTSVKSTEHFLKAIQVAADNGLSVVPIVDSENDIAGAIAYSDLLRHASEFMSLKEPGGLIVLE